MTEAELTLLLTIAKRVHPSFSVDDEITFGIWFELVGEVPFEVAQQNLKEHLRLSEFPPKPANLAGDYFNRPKLSVYDIQAIEQQEQQIALQEYHEKNKVVPMPDHIRAKLEGLVKKRTVGGDVLE
ncbi:hypothetical protein [Paenibacillus hubeiensis]|uniref:hypothetical protein n=1 Tax=Paenibacillus hubeiensis TaxID=3077330 RepID=UPI0031BBB280